MTNGLSKIDPKRAAALSEGVQQLFEEGRGSTEYTRHGSRWSNEDGNALEEIEVTWLCRVASAAVAFRCADESTRQAALDRLVAAIDELPMVLEMRD